MAKTFFITTAIDYTNAAPHIGHAYEKILADVLARFHRLKGEPVYFLTGVDQHGQKVQQAAEKAGVVPAQYAREMTAKFTGLWKKLGISYDGWAETTDPRHRACVQKILQRLHDEGQLYKAKYGGYYSVRQEQFLTDKERGEDGEFGPEWGEVVFLEEENWYFKSGAASGVAAGASWRGGRGWFFPRFAARSCRMRSRKSAAIFASRGRRNGWPGASSCRSMRNT